MSQASFSGVSHIALNVRDVAASVRWYREVLDFVPLFPWNTDDFDRQLIRHPSGVVLALTRHHHPDAGTGFDERRTGLDHLAFTVDSRAELDAWAARLTAAGVTHSGVTVTPKTGFTLLAFRDPDDIQLELYLG
ncbi:VOC family protein [Embleya sp. AB8]|uniref:VOC family protein n=1 Tax=Embleya sp. AB8 TaxID=3156304 RepID=UPI003C74DC71